MRFLDEIKAARPDEAHAVHIPQSEIVILDENARGPRTNSAAAKFTDALGNPRSQLDRMNFGLGRRGREWLNFKNVDAIDALTFGCVVQIRCWHIVSFALRSSLACEGRR